VDHDELAAKAAVANWHGLEGAYAREIQAAKRWQMEGLKRFLDLWGLARSNPIIDRAKLLSFLNEHALPALSEIDARSTPSRHTYAVVEELSERAARFGATKGRPTSLLSKLGLEFAPRFSFPTIRRLGRHFVLQVRECPFTPTELTWPQCCQRNPALLKRFGERIYRRRV